MAPHRTGRGAVGDESCWGITAVGLAGYALWGVTEAVLDVDGDGNGLFGTVKRVGFGINGVGHGALAIITAQLVLGRPTDDGLARVWLFALLGHQGGPLAVTIIGLVVVIVAVAQLFLATTGDVMQLLDTSALTENSRRCMQCIGRGGTAAHGVVLGLVGYSLMRAAAERRSERVIALFDRSLS